MPLKLSSSFQRQRSGYLLLLSAISCTGVEVVASNSTSRQHIKPPVRAGLTGGRSRWVVEQNARLTPADAVGSGGLIALNRTARPESTTVKEKKPQPYPASDWPGPLRRCNAAM